MAAWLSWINATVCANRFDSDDLSQRLITFVQMLAVAGMAASDAESAAIPSAISIALFRLLSAVSYACVRTAIPKDALLANRMVIVMSTIAVVLASIRLMVSFSFWWIYPVLILLMAAIVDGMRWYFRRTGWI